MKKQGLCGLHGWRFASDLLARKAVSPKLLAISAAAETDHLPALPDVEVARLAPRLFRELDVFGTDEPILYCSLPEIFTIETGRLSKGCAVLLPLQNPENLGAAIRSAEAFGAQVILTPNSASPFLPKAIRASAGSVFTCSISMVSDLSPLFDHYGEIFALDSGGKSLLQQKLPERCLLAVGAEGPGHDGMLKGATKISIPMSGQVESLNANVAISIALFEYFRAIKLGRD